MRYEVTTPPSEPILDLDDLKLHLRIDADDENQLLTYFIEEARQAMEDVLRHVGVHTSYRQYQDSFSYYIGLTWGPVEEVLSVSYYDAEGTLTAIDADKYEVVPGVMPPLIRPTFGNEWPTEVRRHPDSVVVEYTAGYADNEAGVPEWFKSLCRKYIGHLYENREASQTLGRGEKAAQAMRLAFESDIWARTARPLV